MTQPRKENTGSPEDGGPPRRNRRQALALGGAAAAAAAAVALAMERGTKAHAATGDPMIVGQSNEASPGDTTKLAADVVNGATLRVENSSTTGVESVGLTGVHGQGNIGVWGCSPDTPPIGFHSPAGVIGEATGSGAAGVHAIARGTEALALVVQGKARFSTAGSGVVPAGTAAAVVLNAAVTADSHITATFTGNPGPARVAWVQRFAGVGFIVRLVGKPPADVSFTYLIVEPGG